MNERRFHFKVFDKEEMAFVLNDDPIAEPNGGAPEGNAFWAGVELAKQKWRRSDDPRVAFDAATQAWETFHNARAHAQAVEVFDCDANLICGACGKVVEQHEAYGSGFYKLCDGAMAKVVQ